MPAAKAHALTKCFTDCIAASVTKRKTHEANMRSKWGR